MDALPSKSQLEKLGKRLARAELPAASDRALLQAYRLAHEAPLEDVLRWLALNGLEATWRLKTPETIIEKLRRERTRLTTMQDIAGARVVADVSLNGQDALVAAIQAAWSGAIVDRRDNPSHGYRAVHVVAVVRGHPVEIQIRTPLQDLWAQIMERVGDRWGRGVRYGVPPEDPRQATAVRTLISMADMLAAHERTRAEIESLDADIAQVRPASPSEASALSKVVRRHDELKGAIEGDELSFRKALQVMAHSLEEGGAS